MSGTELPDKCHCTLGLHPGNAKAHIYIKYTVTADHHFGHFEVIGESVVMKKGLEASPDFSLGVYPPVPVA